MKAKQTCRPSPSCRYSYQNGSKSKSTLSLKNHQGIAFLSPITYQPIEEIVMGAYERGETCASAADGIRVRNLGAMLDLRSVLGFTA